MPRRSRQANHAHRHRLAPDGPIQRAGSDVLYDLFSLVASDAERESMAAFIAARLRLWRSQKKALADAAEKFLGRPRARRAELAAKPDYMCVRFGRWRR